MSLLELFDDVDNSMAIFKQGLKPLVPTAEQSGRGRQASLFLTEDRQKDPK